MVLEGFFQGGDVGDGFVLDEVDEQLGGAFDGNVLHPVYVGHELVDAMDRSSDKRGTVLDVELRHEGHALGLIDDRQGFLGTVDDGFDVEF